MSPKDLELLENLSADDNAGTIHCLKERRMLIFEAEALGFLRKNLVETLGFVEAARISWSFGYASGYRDALDLDKFYKWKDDQAWLDAGPRLLALQGMTAVKCGVRRIDKQAGVFETESEWLNSYEAEQHLRHLGKSDDAGCWTLLGYAAGYTSAAMGRDIYFVETECVGRGDRRCYVIGRSEWDAQCDEVQSFRHAMGRHDLDPSTVPQVFIETGAATRRLIDELNRQRTRVESLESQVFYLQEAIRNESDPNEIIGSSAAFKKTLKNARTVAASDTTALITGETGTGKELFARYIHSHSPLKRRPLVVVNCSALPAGLVEGELFGHEKGAFTGAMHRKLGKFEIAGGGSIFLDEVGEMPLDTQVKFLRVLQEGEFERVGGTQTLKTDVRIIAATNQNLEQLVEDGRFRADLFYRLNVFPITVPPLRERTDDIVSLVNYFAQKFNKRFRKNIISVNQESIERLKQYRFPGNVRELEHLIERSVLTTAGEVLTIDLPLGKIAPANDNFTAIDGKLVSLKEMERNYVEEVLRQTKGLIAGKGGAAEILGLPASTLRSRMKKLGVR
ncbi:MAG: sigma 54-interacting transcriptional regulator [Acidobacteria bacterium]|nr:sigma 54-interacting transcriptional regulator [Acidobacteriota bacterium]